MWDGPKENVREKEFSLVSPEAGEVHMDMKDPIHPSRVLLRQEWENKTKQNGKKAQFSWKMVTAYSIEPWPKFTFKNMTWLCFPLTRCHLLQFYSGSGKRNSTLVFQRWQHADEGAWNWCLQDSWQDLTEKEVTQGQMTGVWKSMEELDQIHMVRSVLQTSRPYAVRVSHLSRKVYLPAHATSNTSRPSLPSFPNPTQSSSSSKCGSATNAISWGDGSSPELGLRRPGFKFRPRTYWLYDPRRFTSPSTFPICEVG